MNEFYSIADIGKEKTNSLQLENLGKDRIFAISGNSNSYHRSYISVTANDYDLDFSNRIITTNPPYNIFALLDFHFQYYTDITKGDRQKFFNHIKYVICPMIEKRKGKGVYIELIGNWIRDKEFSKKKGNGKKKICQEKGVKVNFYQSCIQRQGYCRCFC